MSAHGLSCEQIHTEQPETTRDRSIVRDGRQTENRKLNRKGKRIKFIEDEHNSLNVTSVEQFWTKKRGRRRSSSSIRDKKSGMKRCGCCILDRMGFLPVFFLYDEIAITTTTTTCEYFSVVGFFKRKKLEEKICLDLGIIWIHVENKRQKMFYRENERKPKGRISLVAEAALGRMAMMVTQGSGNF